MRNHLKLYKLKDQPLNISLIGICSNLGVTTRSNTVEAADHLRRHGLLDALHYIGAQTRDLGNYTFVHEGRIEESEKKIKLTSQAYEKTSTALEKELREGRKVISIGGDHSISIGSISSGLNVFNDEVGVIWIDAHADVNTLHTSPSKNIHGMPVAYLTMDLNDDLSKVIKNKLKKDQLMYIGLKEVDEAEIDTLSSWEETEIFTILDIEKSGVGSIFEAIDRLAQKVKYIWISLDVDSIDAEFAPATPMQNKGGLTYREIQNIFRYIGQKTNVVGLDIGEFAPSLDKDNKTTDLLIELIALTFGKQFSDYEKYLANSQKNLH